MKHLNKIILIAVVAVCCFACKKSFLDRPSQAQISSDNFYKTTSDLRLATANLYGGSPWGIWHHEAFLPLGDILSGNGNRQWIGDWVSFIHAPLPPGTAYCRVDGKVCTI